MARYDDALKYWEEGYNIVWDKYVDLFKSRYLLLKAKVLLRKGDYNEISDIIAEANSFHPLEENYFIAATAEFRLNRVESARKLLLDALEKKPGYNEAENMLMEIIPYSQFKKDNLYEPAGISWDTQKVFEEAISDFYRFDFEVSHQKFLNSFIKKPAIEILFRNWFKEECESLENILKKDKIKPEERNKTLLLLANLNHYIIGNGSAAKDYYLKLLQNDNENFEGYLNYGVIMQKERKYNIAFENLKKAVQLNSESGRANFFLGLNFLKIGNIETGHVYLSKAVKISVKFKESFYSQLILEELKSFVPYDDEDKNVINKYSFFFENSSELSEEFNELRNKFNNM